MTVEEVLDEASRYGVHIRTDGVDLLLSAKAKPPDIVLNHLRDHKAEIIAMLPTLFIIECPNCFQPNVIFDADLLRCWACGEQDEKIK